MGTKVDHMSLASHVDNENNLVAKRIITKEAQRNRELLRLVMQHAGFKSLRTECGTLILGLVPKQSNFLRW